MVFQLPPSSLPSYRGPEPGCRETSPPFRPSWEPGPPRLPRTKPPRLGPNRPSLGKVTSIWHLNTSRFPSWHPGLGLASPQPLSRRHWRPLSGPAPGTARRSRPEPPPGDLARPKPSGPERGCGLGQRHVGSAISRVIRWRIARGLQGRRAARLLRRGGLAPGPRLSWTGPQR